MSALFDVTRQFGTVYIYIYIFFSLFTVIMSPLGLRKAINPCMSFYCVSVCVAICVCRKVVDAVIVVVFIFVYCCS